MLAPKQISDYQRVWNRKWQAPFGGAPFTLTFLRNTSLDIRRRGPFAWQSNNSTRVFEYPWAYDQIHQRGKALTVVEVGGSLSGLQFVLAKEGHRVVNVDPGLAAGGRGWALDERMHSRLCRCYAAPVELIPTKLDMAGLADDCADVVMCISALEHFSDDDAASFAEQVSRILKPGGVLVMTVDLFLDLAPFTDRESNEWGRNMDLYSFLKRSGLDLARGDPSQLFGFLEFRANSVLSQLAQFMIGLHYPCLAQCLVAVAAK